MNPTVSHNLNGPGRGLPLQGQTTSEVPESTRPSSSPVQSPLGTPTPTPSAVEPLTLDSLSLQERTAPTSSTTSTSASNANSSELSFFRRWSSNWVAARRRFEDPEEGIHGELGLRPLHISSESLIDFVFVHGLKGGSVKTWRKGTDPRYFWPKYWLPLEHGFENASIHSFGYDSDWGAARQSILNVQDFGKALFEELRTSHHLRNHSPSPIILIGHSMGGLVIKQALISACREEGDQQLRNRIRSIFFLATPHRGSNLGSVLKNIVAISRIPKPFLADVANKSISAQRINDEFVRYANGLSILSFYETLPMSIGGLSAVMVVDKASAVIGIEGERSSLINANHRDICKFDGRDDPNYIKIRDALSAEIEIILRDVVHLKQKEARSQLMALRGFLGIQPQPDYSYDQVQGTCVWIESRDDFCDWRDPPDSDMGQSPSIYWISAHPGTGKTLLATHVISHLQQCKLACSYYYFQFGKKASQTLSDFLRSMAYQMAQSNAAVRDVLLQLQQDGSTFDVDDARAIWTKLYKRGVLLARTSTPQYWIVDALDECLEYSEIFTLLKRDAPRFPLRMFITSRRVPEIKRLCQQFGSSLTLVDIPADKTLEDIGRYLESRLDDLPIDTEDEKRALSRAIITKSGACFLWVRVVLDELRGAWADQSMLEILEQIPDGMLPYYKRTIGGLAENRKEKEVVKAILLWTTMAARPLHTAELAHALELEIQKTFPSIASAVEALCGQLVVVDKNTGFMYIIHATAREFLLSEGAGEFAVDPAAAHERLAMTCLKLLQSKELAVPRNWRVSPADRNIPPFPLLDYADGYVSDHISLANPSENGLLLDLYRFFGNNVLTWIDRLCRHGNLNSLIRNAKNLAPFLDNQAGRTSPPSQQQLQTIEDWSVTLERLATKFGPALLHSPSSIYFLIPPLCPINTEIYKSFGQISGGITLISPHNKHWNDCIATITYEDEILSASACGDVSIAIGSQSGTIRLLHHRSLQQETIIYTEEAVNILHFALGGKYIATCSHKFVSLWDRNSKLLWKSRQRSRCITLASTSEELIGITGNGRSWRWDLLSGKIVEEHKYPYQSIDPPPEGELVLDRAPAFASLSPDMEVLALAYSSGPVCLWDFQQQKFIDWAVDPGDAPCHRMLFNPNIDTPMLLVASTNSRLSVYDSWSGHILCTWDPDCQPSYDSIACSPNGRILATVDIYGFLRIREFGSLALLYQVYTRSAFSRGLEFTSDSRAIIEISVSGLQVWSPPVLVRKARDGVHNRETLNSSLATNQTSLRGLRITAISAHPTRGVVFAVSNFRIVLVYDVKTGRKHEIYNASLSMNEKVFLLASSSVDTLAMSNNNHRVDIYKLDMTNFQNIQLQPVLFQFELKDVILQLLFDHSGDFLLTSTDESDKLYSVSKKECLGSIEFNSINKRRDWKWFNVPKPKSKGSEDESSQFGLVIDGQLRFYSVMDFPSHDGKTFTLGYKFDEGFTKSRIHSVRLHEPSGTLILHVRKKAGIVDKSATLLFKKHIHQAISNSTPSASWRPVGNSLRNKSSHVLGIITNHLRNASDRLVFLHRNSWVASVPIHQHGVGETIEEYTQHFYAPREFVSLPPMVMPGGEVVFCTKEGLVTVTNGLRFEEVRKFERGLDSE